MFLVCGLNLSWWGFFNDCGLSDNVSTKKKNLSNSMKKFDKTRTWLRHRLLFHPQLANPKFTARFNKSKQVRFRYITKHNIYRKFHSLHTWTASQVVLCLLVHFTCKERKDFHMKIKYGQECKREAKAKEKINSTKRKESERSLLGWPEKLSRMCFLF